MRGRSAHAAGREELFPPSLTLRATTHCKVHGVSIRERAQPSVAPPSHLKGRLGRTVVAKSITLVKFQVLGLYRRLDVAEELTKPIWRFGAFYHMQVLQS